MTICKGICPRTHFYFFFVTNAERGLRQGEHNSTKTSSIKIIKFPIILPLLFLFIMKNCYMFSI